MHFDSLFERPPFTVTPWRSCACLLTQYEANPNLAPVARLGLHAASVSHHCHAVLLTAAFMAWLSAFLLLVDVDLSPCEAVEYAVPFFSDAISSACVMLSRHFAKRGFRKVFSVFYPITNPHGRHLTSLCCALALALLRYVADAWSGVGRATLGKPLGFPCTLPFYSQSNPGSVSAKTC